MEPIVSPFIVYLLGIVDNVILAATLISVFVGLALGIVMGPVRADCYREERKTCDKWGKILGIALLVFIPIAMLTPNKTTIIGMYTASVATPNNLKIGKDIVVNTKNELKKDILEVIGALTEEEE